jgi:two-component system chemotaxis sensor kinase CheA
MSIRAQPVKAVFSRMPRLVRELALNLGKDVRLEMDGENTEIDKTVIERLGEPLTHMIRNALDHGIESPEERVRLGKTEYGTIRLSAEHKSGRIVIKIEDDGRGINRERVLEKAKAQGILPPEANPTGEEIDHLVFHPGFSTAAEVTNISGRGVGMDVVKKSIQALGGRITIHSVEGQGCSFNLLLPLTLAVLDGMLVKVGQECFVIPIIHIMETIRPPEKNVHKLVGNLEVLDARNKNIPLVYLHQVFGVEGAITDPTKGIVVIVETEGGEEVGLVVDELVAQQQVVLKSLEANYDPIAGISAATILGNGRVSLILDVNAFKKRSIH